MHGSFVFMDKCDLSVSTSYKSKAPPRGARLCERKGKIRINCGLILGNKRNALRCITADTVAII